MAVSRRFALAGLGALAVTATGCCCAPPSTEHVKSAAQLDDYLGQLVATGKPPGLALMVTQGNQVRYARGFGMADGPRRRAATPETVFNWWSLTKMFTVVAVMQLQEAGQLNIDQPVERYLPFFKVESSEPGWGPITIRQLLNHSSGLGDVGLSVLGWIHHDPSQAKNQTALIQQRFGDYRHLRYQPGTEAQYSNIGYMVLGALIEKVSGLSYEDYVRRHILQPLGMNHTDFVYRPEMVPVAAAGSHPFDFLSLVAFTQIDRDKAIREKVDGVYWFNPIYPDQAAPSGLIGSPADLAQFLIALQDGGRLLPKPLLSAQSIAEMNRPQVKVTKSDAGDIPGLRLGLGWFHLQDASGRESLTHGGSGMGFVTMMRIYPREATSVIVMANSTYLTDDQGLQLVNLAGDMTW